MAEPGEGEHAGDAEDPRHGGDLSLATRRYGEPRDGWLDLSTGVNPVPYPVRFDALEITTRLPGGDEIAALIAAAQRAYDASAATSLIAAPGSEAAIRLLPLVAPPGAVAVVAPTYATHAEAWQTAGRTVVEIGSVEAVPDHVAIAVVGNPNNPDGRIVEPDALAALARRLETRGGLLVVDEAFADIAPEVSLMPSLADAPAVVLRSLGKFYGLPGLRLGFVAGPAGVVRRLASLLGDWPVSGPAIAAGRAALADDAWRAAARVRLKRDIDQVHDIFDRHGLAIVGGTDLFVLIEDDEAPAIHRHLAARGIWTRAFAYRPTWLRFGLPAEDGFARLDRALATIL